MEIAKDVQENLKFPTFSADDIEKSKKPFVAKDEAVAIVASRYDGIDFPGKECRLLFIDGLPKATNLQERFLMARMGANILTSAANISSFLLACIFSTNGCTSSRSAKWLGTF